jgi:hypothetical protein
VAQSVVSQKFGCGEEKKSFWHIVVVSTVCRSLDEGINRYSTVGVLYVVVGRKNAAPLCCWLSLRVFSFLL